MSNIIASAGYDSGEAPTEPAATASVAPPPLTGFAAGITGAVLVIAGVWGLHVISRAGGFTVSAGSVILLLAAFTALGKGITLLRRALDPILAAAAMAVSGVPALLRAVTSIIVGAIGAWWVLRGHASTWWAHTTGTSTSWTLISALVQVALIAIAGALLFGGARTLAAALGLHIQRGDRWTAWWSSRPGLGLMLLAGAAAIVALSGYIVPQVSGRLASGDPQAVLIAIAVILIAGLLANTWWWAALTGWWTWAHRPHTPGGGATPMGQMYAGAGVVALLWVSATAFGLAVPDSYTGPGAMPRARADCPPDCGGSNGGSNSFGPNGSQFQPPQMPDPPGQYQGGANSYPGLDQNNGISLYNPGAGQGSEPAQGGYASQGQPGPPANGVQPPNYDAPLQPQATAPQHGSVAPQQSPSGPQQAPVQQPAQAPQQAPAQQGPQQPAQQPQGQPQSGPQNQPTQQAQPAQQQPQNQKPTTPKKEPNSPIDPTDLAAAATRRGSQQAGQQAAQTAGQQATQQATQQSTQQATQQSTQQSAQQASPKAPEHNSATAKDLAFKGGQAANDATEGVVKANEWAVKQAEKEGLTIAEDATKVLSKVGKATPYIGPLLDIAAAGVNVANGAPVGESAAKAALSIGGSLVGGFLGGLTGPLAPVAVPLLAGVGGFLAEKAYDWF